MCIDLQKRGQHKEKTNTEERRSAKNFNLNSVSIFSSIECTYSKLYSLNTKIIVSYEYMNKYIAMNKLSCIVYTRCTHSFHNIKLVCKGYAICTCPVYTIWKLFGNWVHFLTVSKSETPGIQTWKLFVHVCVQRSFQFVH